MSKAFKKETDESEEPEQPEPAPDHVKNYMTPFGFAQLQDELRELANVVRPKIVETVRWAAGNGDRSENADYTYGKKRLREIDKRARYLTKRLQTAIVVDPKLQSNLKQVFFGATVTYTQKDNSKKTVKIVGVDEADLTIGKISWLSPVAKVLLKSQVGDIVKLHTLDGDDSLKVLSINYEVDK